MDDPDDPAGRDERDEDDDRAEDRVPEQPGRAVELDDLVAEVDPEDGADEGAEEVARPADQARDERDRRLAPVDRVGGEARVRQDPEPASDGAEGARDHEGHQLVALDPDAGELGPPGVVPDRAQRIAERRRA